MRVRHQKKACRRCNRFLRITGKLFKHLETACPRCGDVGTYDVPKGIVEALNIPRRSPTQPVYAFEVRYKRQKIGTYEVFNDAVNALKNAKEAKTGDVEKVEYWDAKTKKWKVR